MTEGQVVEAVGGRYAVRAADGRRVEAALRGRLKQASGAHGRVVIGDRVDLAPVADGLYTIESVRPRSTILARHTLGGRVARVVAANLDHLVVVASVADPPPRQGVIDRMLVMGEAGGMESSLVLNKVDLVRGQGMAADLLHLYGAAGVPVLATSAVSGEGLDAFGELVRSGASALAGPSGVGKSSLLNAVDPSLGLRVRRVGRRSRAGRHTTVSSRLVDVQGGGIVADTPGFSDVGLEGVSAERLPWCFPEFRPHLGRCRFGDCAHLREPDCAVRAAVNSGLIQRVRYECYAAIRGKTAVHG